MERAGADLCNLGWLRNDELSGVLRKSMTYPRLSWKLQGYPMSPKNMNRQGFFFPWIPISFIWIAQLKALVARDLLRQSGKQDVTASNPMRSCKPLSVAMRWAAYNFKSSHPFLCKTTNTIHATEAQEAKKVRATAPQRLEEALRCRRTAAPAAAAAAPPSAGWAAVRTPPKAVAVNTVRGVAKEDVFGRNDSFTEWWFFFGIDSTRLRWTNANDYKED